jgi:hypothetical protein
MTWQPVEIRPNEQQAIVSQPKPGFSLDLKIVCFIFRWKGIRGGSTLQTDCLCNRHFLPFVGVYLNAVRPGRRFEALRQVSTSDLPSST